MGKIKKDGTYFEMGDNSGMRTIDTIQNKNVFGLLKKSYQLDFINE